VSPQRAKDFEALREQLRAFESRIGPPPPLPLATVPTSGVSRFTEEHTTMGWIIMHVYNCIQHSF